MDAAISSGHRRSPAELAEASGKLLEALRASRPLVQAVTNYVSMDIAANVLLAIGASPAMVHAPEEAEEFGALASALVVNVGTLSSDFVVSMEAAATVADRLGKPWVLDPVGAGATRFRDEAIGRLLALRPTVIRGNASEIIGVARIAGLHGDLAKPKGVDSAHQTGEARSHAVQLARHLNCIVAATGAVDLVTDGDSVIALANGSPLMEKVTAMGCALSAMVAAFVALTPDRFAATAAAIAIYGVTGELAAETASGPGSFRVDFLDWLAKIKADDISRRLKSS